jgi:hypothetical protein
LSDETPIEKIYTAFFEEAFPADLKVALAWLEASILAIYLPFLNESPFRVVLTVARYSPFLLFFVSLSFCRYPYPRILLPGNRPSLRGIDREKQNISLPGMGVCLSS